MTQDPRKPLRRSPSPLAPAELGIIKKLLWDGMANQEVAVVAGVRLGRHVHPSTVSRIKTGKIGGSVLWPDGSQGGIPERSVEDWSPDSMSLAEWPDEYQETILDTVNAKRRARGQEEIPPVSLDYQTYLTSPIEERQVLDPLTVQDLLKSEDRRRALLINEFKILQENALEESLQESILTCIEDTKEEREKDTPEIDMLEWIRYDKADWSAVLEIIPSHPLVMEALREQDAVLAEAIAIILHNFRGDPKSLDIEDRVKIICSLLNENPAQRAHIQENSAVASFMDEEEKGGE